MIDSVSGISVSGRLKIDSCSSIFDSGFRKSVSDITKIDSRLPMGDSDFVFFDSETLIIDSENPITYSCAYGDALGPKANRAVPVGTGLEFTEGLLPPATQYG